MLPAEKFNLDVIHAGVPEIFSPAVELTVLASHDGVQLDGEPDLIVELIDLYQEDAQRRVAVMRQSLAKRDWTSVKREAHSLRGSSSNLGAFKLASLCGEIEGLVPEDQSCDIEALINELEHELERALDVFSAERLRRLQ
ncbi:MAG TPA: Hpt domain-containing protein [Pyrinomonadaceae bacterium]|jgi:HPt (histidine-containing phosphotransfer) domain-containing protein